MLRTTTTTPPRPSEIFAAIAAKIVDLRKEAARARSVGALQALNKAAAALKGLEAGNYVSPVSAQRAVEKEVRKHLLTAERLLRGAKEADKATAARRGATPSSGTEEWIANIIGRPLPRSQVA